jgi:diacylglycerol O-acyltransferase
MPRRSELICMWRSRRCSTAGRVDIDRIRAHVAARLRLIPRYRQRLGAVPFSRRPIWVDDDRFNIAYHVRHVSLPRPGDEKQLRLLAGRIKSQQLDREKPLWEMFVVEGLRGHRFAVVIKTHHCMLDGVSGADLLAVLLGVEPQASPDAAAPFLPRPVPTWPELIAADALWRIREPLEFARSAASSPRDAFKRLTKSLRAVTDLLPSAFKRAMPSPFNRPVGPHRRFDWLEMDLGSIRDIKARLGGTVNDVVLAIVSGAVRRFLQHRDEAVDTGVFRALVPVSVRDSSDQGMLGNRVAAWIADLPIAERDPSRRLRALQETTAELKRTEQTVAANLLTGMAGWAGSSLLSNGVQLVLRARPFNLIITNVPGPQCPLYLLDAKITEVYPQVPLFTEQGLGIALFSYDGKLFWGFNADYDLVPDLAEFTKAVDASHRELRVAAGLEIEQAHPLPSLRSIARRSG